MQLFSAEEVLSSLVALPLQDQVSVLEALLNDYEIADIADHLSLCLMTVFLDVDASCPKRVRERLDRIVASVRQFNEQRFGPSLTAN